MWPPRALLPLLALLALLAVVHPAPDQQPVYHNQFAVHVPAGRAAASGVAARLGYVNKGQIGTLPNFFLFEHPRLRKRSLQGADGHRSALHKEPEVAWAQQQVERRRTKRDFRGEGSLTALTAAGVAAGVANGTRAARSSGPYSMFPDPLFKDQWYLNGDTEGSLDMHIQDAWQRGYTGKGVVVSILDDGIQGNHPDLSQNYDPMASADINDSDADPTPRDNGDNKHGTRCAGEVAAQAFNTFCGVGVAYHASIGGVRMLDGTVNDAVEAAALSVNPSHIDVYSASWGPEDDGKTVDGPGPLAKRAFLQGVSAGRKGKGSIFVWASGNGGRHTDSCNCDGYTNSIFTLSISSATQGGYKPWYLEECSSTLATTYSSGTPGRDKSVATVDMDGQLRPDHLCTSEHTGTSASAPLAAGICALALEANPSLGWRDMQHLVVRTSRAAPLEREDGWVLNGAKRKVSHKFGYGLMDAAAMVTMAETWTAVPPQHICKSQEMTEERPIDAAKGALLEMQVDVNGCRGTANEIRHLEHVQARVTLRYSPRGALRITLTSPMGTTSVLLTERPLDTESSNLDDWAFLSVHFWGERADGRWTLRVSNQGKEAAKQNGVVKKWQLVLYGTATDPLYTSSNSTEAGAGGAGGLSVVELVPLDGGGGAADAGYHVGDKPAPPLPASMRPLILHDCDHECLESAGCYGKGPTACLACRHYKLDNACVSRCPPRSYLSKDASCLPCHESCETCAGPGQDSCLSCAPAHLRVTDLAVCLQQCPDGYFEDSERGLCIPCASNCVSCSDQPDRCTFCAERLLMHDSRCFAACPPGTFNISLDRCQECHSSCDTCAGPDETQCISCPAGRYFLSGTCLRGCPEGWHPDKHAQECAACALGCTLCTNSGCLVCAQGWVLGPEGRCSREGSGRCKDGEHLNQASGRCSACDAGCLTCHGPGADACLSCPAASPMLYAGRCYPACPDGAYLQDRQQDQQANTCARCPHTCKACVSRQNCTACAPGLELQSGQCRVACADGYYSDGGVCSACYLSCATCVGPRKDECVSCPKGWQLLGGACHPDCPQGHFQTQYGCTRCHHSCRSCDGEGPASCTSCGSRHVLQDGRCAECVRGQYYDATLRRCAACDATCAACSGPGPYSCTACAAPLQLHKRHHQCVPCCSASTATPATCCRCRTDSMQGVCPDVSSAGKRRIAEAAVATPFRAGLAEAVGLAGAPGPQMAEAPAAPGPLDWRGVAGPQPAGLMEATSPRRHGPHTTSISLTTTTATLAVAVAALLVLIVGIVVTMLQSRSRLAGLAAGRLPAPRGAARGAAAASRVRGRGRGRPRGRSRDLTAEEEGLLENTEDIQDFCEDSPSVRRDLLGSSPPLMPHHAVKT